MPRHINITWQINKSNTLTKIVFGYSQSIKAGNNVRLDSPLLDIFLSTFRMNTQVLDILQFVIGSLNCTKLIKILYDLSTMYETLQTVKDLINSSNNSTYKNLRQDRAQKHNCSEIQVCPKVLNKFIVSGLILCYKKNQQDATLAVLFISNCKITLHVSDVFCFHHQEY